MRRLLRQTVLIVLAAASTLAVTRAPQDRLLVLDGVRIIDGTGGPQDPRERDEVEDD